MAAWLGAAVPRGYADVTDQVDVRGVDLLNADSDLGGARALFLPDVPSALASDSDKSKDKGKGKGKGKEKADQEADDAGFSGPDWVESDTDEQLMLFMPFNSTLRVHTLQLTSLPPQASGSDDDAPPARPKTVQLFSNRPHNLGFEEAEGIQATQEITFGPDDWDPATGTAKAELRFVKFQNVTSLVLFVVDGEGGRDRVRLDRVRLVGESGGKREMGKLEKVGADE